MYPLGHGPPLLCKLISFAWERLCGYLMAALWQWVCVKSGSARSIRSARSTTRGKNTACVLLCPAGENAPVCSSYDSFRFLPASVLRPHSECTDREARHTVSILGPTLGWDEHGSDAPRWPGPTWVPKAWQQWGLFGYGPPLLRRQHPRRYTCWGPGQSPNNRLPPSPTFCSRTWSLREEGGLSGHNEPVTCSALIVVS